MVYQKEVELIALTGAMEAAGRPMGTAQSANGLFIAVRRGVDLRTPRCRFMMRHRAHRGRTARPSAFRLADRSRRRFLQPR